jgi:hypothetical protein
MEFKTNAALAEWANDQTMPEIAAHYNGLPGVKPVKKFDELRRIDLASECPEERVKPIVCSAKEGR